MGNTFGQLFRVTTFGESHGRAVGVVVDGCPPRLPLSERDIQPDLDRRRPGQSAIVTPRDEADTVEILSGVFEGRTTGAPVAMLVRNTDARPSAYAEIRTKFRPSHADFTYLQKFGIRDWRGGGRASARETIGRVAAGAIARKWLRRTFGVEVLAWVRQVHALVAKVDPSRVGVRQIEATPVRCPDHPAARRMIRLIERVRAAGDTVGGVVECVARSVPSGWGEPVFDKLEADLAKALLSLPACKGFEIGSGFAGAAMKGVEHNDRFLCRGGRIRTRTNFSGGVQGGISNGEDLVLRAAFKPVATLMRPQRTVDARGRFATLAPKGRHDPCVLPRAVPMVEAMVLLVLADHALRQRRISRAS
ncbi:MAG: chorismate synthase [Verrucomicrobiae bacterium]|nr:chorismate synthase [Verrucomicrobiae bacterium]